MTITQLIQNSPANANELFAKLAATGNGAVKTRENLFEELKAELALHSRLEEEHLFPVLKKHKETKELVRMAVDGNKQARALVAELDSLPKDGEEFLVKLAELRKSFQEHIRDEKKDLLPAVKVALSAEAAQAIADKVEAEKAAVAEAKRQEAEKSRAAARQQREKVEAKEAAAAEAKRQKANERRAAARLEREKAERRAAQTQARRQRAVEEEKRQQAEMRAEERRVHAEEKRLQAEAEAAQLRARETGAALARTGEDLVSGGQTLAAAGMAAGQAGTEAVLRNSHEVGGAVSDSLGQTGALFASAVQSYADRARPVMERLEAMASLSPNPAIVATETGKAWFDLLARNAENRGRTSRNLMSCFTPQQVAQVQARYVGDAMGALLEANARMMDISMKAYRGMMQPTAPASDRNQESRKSA